MTKMKDRGVRTYIFISNKNEGEIGVGSRMLNQQIRLKKSGIGEIQLQSILGGIGCTFELTEFFSIQSSFLSYTQKCDTLRITGNRMERLPLETRTLYAELMDQLTALEAGRSLGSVPGTFVRKIIKGRTYLYFQHSEPGGTKRQIYLGPEDNSLAALVARFEKERDLHTPELRQIQRLCAQLRAGGCLTTGHHHARVLSSLADAGLFSLDAVLVGTQAFLVLGNILGVRWRGGSLRTEDIDIAGDRAMVVGTERVDADLPGALERLNMGFFPVPSLNSKDPSTSFKVRGEALRVDLVTPAWKRNEHDPVVIRRFRAAAQPVPFLQYLLDHSIRGAIIDGDGILVNVPDPARFALHKLIVAAKRDVTMAAKSEKDLHQASQLLAFLAEDRPGDLPLANEDLVSRGQKWKSCLQKGMRLLKKDNPELHDRVMNLL